MNEMNAAQRANVTDAALVELFTELDNWDCPMRQGGISVDEFLDYYAAHSGGNLSNKYEILKHAAQDGYFNGVTIQDINKANGAVVVYNQAADTYTVSFCGTRGYEWNDNYVGITQESSHYQRSAALYFDTVSREFNSGSKVVVSGHSKGGNKAQYVTMFSQNRDVIDTCVALDGQGFSDSAMEAMQEHDDFEQQQQKILLVCGNNDYVHVLGNRLAKEDNTFYLYANSQNGLDAFEENHLVEYLFARERYSTVVEDPVTHTCHTETGWQYTYQLKGETEAGTMAEFMELLYQRLKNELPEEDFRYVAKAIMDFMAGNISLKAVVQTSGLAGDLIIDTVYNTQVGQQLLVQLSNIALGNEDMQGIKGNLLLAFIWVVLLPLEGDEYAAYSKLSTLLGRVLNIKLPPTLRSLLEMGIGITSAIADLHLDEWLYVNFGIRKPEGMDATKQADLHTTIDADAAELQACAVQMKALSTRVGNALGSFKTALNGMYGQLSTGEIVAGYLINKISGIQNAGENAIQALEQGRDGLSALGNALQQMASYLEEADRSGSNIGNVQL